MMLRFAGVDSGGVEERNLAGRQRGRSSPLLRAATAAHLLGRCKHGGCSVTGALGVKVTFLFWLFLPKDQAD